MRKVLIIAAAIVSVTSGLALGAYSAKTAHAITFTELKCMYNPTFPGCKYVNNMPKKISDNKNNG